MKYTNFKSGMRLISPQTYTYAASTCMEQDTLCLGPCPCQHPSSPQVCYFDTYHYQFFSACSSIPCKWPCWTNSLLALLFLHHIYKSMQSGNVASPRATSGPPCEQSSVHAFSPCPNVRFTQWNGDPYSEAQLVSSSSLLEEMPYRLP